MAILLVRLCYNGMFQSWLGSLATVMYVECVFHYLYTADVLKLFQRASASPHIGFIANSYAIDLA